MKTYDFKFNPNPSEEEKAEIKAANNKQEKHQKLIMGARERAKLNELKRRAFEKKHGKKFNEEQLFAILTEEGDE